MTETIRAVLRSRFVVLPLVLAILTGLWNLYISQNNGGVVRGRVTGADGQPVAGATVRMLEQNFTTNSERAIALSSPDGTFQFTDNRSHNIKLRAEKTGLGRSGQQTVRLFFRAQNVELAQPLVIEPVKAGE
jgi:hypothetical protein